MTHPNKETATCAAALYEFLVERQAADIPTCTEIGALLEVRLPWKPDGHRVFQAMKWLDAQRMVQFHHTRKGDERRGQMAVLLPLHNKVLKTPGCTFDEYEILTANEKRAETATPARMGLTGVRTGRTGPPASRGRLCDDSTQAPTADSCDLGAGRQDQNSPAVGSGASPRGWSPPLGAHPSRNSRPS